MSYFTDKNGNTRDGRIVGWVIGSIAFLIIVGMVGWPRYRVWNESLKGKALLAHAQYSKEVAVAEAKAKMESAELLAQAEVSRAKGVASANQIIGESLRDNETYLWYLWITDVAGANIDKTVVYVPTEANLPVLEALRFANISSRSDQ
jgi:regulator of protease activity HflC (stomatin/prohibitin superfamily)